jgi:NAD(P)-dependent dehydrogenase (short-subunit alcohol dehydrogenase family)
VNYLAPFLLTNLLLDVLKISAPARIINVDSDNHRFVRLDMQDLQLQHRYGFLRAYGRSKLALLLFIYCFAKEYERRGDLVAE